jgi:NADP-dependent 3-hydroxy acid dehydrogenase YdfG
MQATQALAVNGAKVYIVGRTKEKLDTVVERYGRDIAGEIIPLVGDVTKKDGVECVPLFCARVRMLNLLCQATGARDRCSREVSLHPRQQRRYRIGKDGSARQGRGRTQEQLI